MRNLLMPFILLLAFCKPVCAQKRVVTGYVKDRATGEFLIDAAIRANRSGIGTITNKSGYFSLETTTATTLTISYIGYEKQQILVDTLGNTQLTIALTPVENIIGEVAVVAKLSELNPQPGVLNIPVAQLKQVPMPLGETDVVKALALTPGVSVGNEATAGLLVRGGSPDQNLIRLDDATLYNQTHLFGFASSFNSDAVKHVTLYKGAFPARFGGRLSSVLDVTTRDGNQYKTTREINVGLLSSRFLIEGPLNRRWRRPTTYMLSARSSYITLFLLPTIISYNQGKSEGYINYWLYDLNAKVTTAIDSVRKLSFSIFRGQDNYYGWDGNRQERSKFGLDWGNTTGTLRYEQIIRKKMFWTSLISYSQYRYQTGYKNYLVENGTQQLMNQNGISSSVRDWTLRSGLEWFVSPRYELRAGAEAILHRYQPSAVRTNDALINPAINAVEQAIYVENEWKPTGALSLNAGLRTVVFVVSGKVYPSVEPRLSGTYQLPGKMSLSASYSQMRQFVHLLGSNVIGFPNDVWVPATADIPPQVARQVSVGLSRSFAGGQLRFSVEAYLKQMRNLIDVPTGTDLLAEFNQSWQDNIGKEGIGRVRGLEVFLHKPTGRFNGWLSYTLSKSKRRFATIDGGAWFRANFDRRHVMAATLNYGLSRRVNFSAVWQYQSGQPATVPSAFFYAPGTGGPNYVYGARNSFEMPPFHRLDLSFSFKKLKAGNRHRTWNLGVMNAYNRPNPLFISIENRSINTPFVDRTVDQKTLGYDTRLTQQSFSPVLPYLSYAKNF